MLNRLACFLDFILYRHLLLMTMLAKRIHLAIVILLISQTFAQDTQWFTMTKMAGWQFNCVNTTCAPFYAVTPSTMGSCQRACLSQIQCKALGFRATSRTCTLLNDIPYPAKNMSYDADTTTMIVIAGTRMPSGQYTENPLMQ